MSPKGRIPINSCSNRVLLNNDVSLRRDEYDAQISLHVPPGDVPNRSLRVTRARRAIRPSAGYRLITNWQAAATPFTEIEVAGGGNAVTVGDFNNDTIPDIATANQSANNVTIFLGVGDGTFDPQETAIETGGDGPGLITRRGISMATESSTWPSAMRPRRTWRSCRVTGPENSSLLPMKRRWTLTVIYRKLSLATLTAIWRWTWSFPQSRWRGARVFGVGRE